jgi:glycosyltransferase involved in cell wall biosynthesis
MNMGLAAPVVSIVVPVFQPHPVYFRAAIESLLRQSFADLEIIVVEDPSPSSGLAILAGIDDARLVHIVNAERTSLPRQHNRGLAAARGTFLCRFDADDVSHPDRIARQLEFLRSTPDVDVVGTWLTVIDSESRPIGERRYPTKHAEIIQTMCRYNPIANSSVMFRRQIYERFGGWRDSTRPAQDYEWYSRIATGGARFANLPETLVSYRLHPGSIKSSKLRDTIRTTLEVKRLYWSGDMGVGARCLMALERALLLLPPALVLQLFLHSRYRVRR